MKPRLLPLPPHGTQILYAEWRTPHGNVVLAEAEGDPVLVAFLGEETRATVLHRIQSLDTTAELRQDPRVETRWRDGDDLRPSPRLRVRGTPFQLAVWQALLAIPCGKTCTYADLARAVQRPRAVRAVGTAVGANPLAWLIPCHRVVRSDGGLGGYHWGLPVKRSLLAAEGAATA